MSIKKYTKKVLLYLLLIILCFVNNIYSINNNNTKESNQTIYKADDTNNIKVVYVQPKIFSPDEDEIVRFNIENPNFSEIKASIFNIEGIVILNSLPRESENVLYWNGKDEDNNIVSSGVYIYQIEADAKVINGTVVVAR